MAETTGLNLSMLHGLAADIFILEQSRTLIFNLNSRLVAKNCNIWRQALIQQIFV
jgi:hypothetical protein